MGRGRQWRALQLIIGYLFNSTIFTLSCPHNLVLIPTLIDCFKENADTGGGISTCVYWPTIIRRQSDEGQASSWGRVPLAAHCLLALSICLAGCQQELSGVVGRVPLIAHCSLVPPLMPTHALSYHYPLPSCVICTPLHVLGWAGVPLRECVICASVCISIVLVWPSMMRLVRLVVPELLLMTGL